MNDQPRPLDAEEARSPSRRDVLGATGAAGLLLMNPGSLFAQGADAANTIKVGFISPRTGALASFGEVDGFVLGLARKALASGLMVGGKKYTVEILERDTQSDPSRASQLAKALINTDKIDLMLAISTPETVNPVADACEAAGVPCLSSVMPWEAWYFGRGAKPGQPSPFKWTFHFSFGVGEFAKAYVSQWALLPTNKKVGVLYPNDADGNAIRANLAPALEKAGFTIVDAGPYEDGTTDYSAQIAKFKAEKCEIFNTFPIPPDFAAFWRQAAQQGYTKMVKIAQIAKTGLFASTVEALGPLGYNLASGCYWHKTFPYKSALTGISGAGLDVAARRRLRSAQGERFAQGQGERCQSTRHVADYDHGRKDRFHQGARARRLRDTAARHAVGQGPRRSQAQVRLRHHRKRRRPERAGGSQAAALRLSGEEQRPHAGPRIASGGPRRAEALRCDGRPRRNRFFRALRRGDRRRRPQRRRQDDADGRALRRTARFGRSGHVSRR
jgi:branched-chain amino acid transport system substrate-binding protein